MSLWHNCLVTFFRLAWPVSCSILYAVKFFLFLGRGREAGCQMHCRMCGYPLGPHLQNAIGSPSHLVVTTPNLSKHCQPSSGRGGGGWTPRVGRLLFSSLFSSNVLQSPWHRARCPVQERDKNAHLCGAGHWELPELVSVWEFPLPFLSSGPQSSCRASSVCTSRSRSRSSPSISNSVEVNGLESKRIFFF